MAPGTPCLRRRDPHGFTIEEHSVESTFLADATIHEKPAS